MIRALAFVLFLFVPILVQAQSADEIDIFAAIIEQPEGTPFATATVVAGGPGRVTYLTASTISPSSGACVRIWDRGPCHAMEDDIFPLPGHAGLALNTAAVTQEDSVAKFSTLTMTRQPLVGAYDAASGEGITFATQNALGGWERPLAPAIPSGQSSGQIVLANEAFTSLSIGAPLVHPEDGLVGIASRAADGSVLMLPIREALLATQAAGFEVAVWMLPDAPAERDLPPRVESEIGRMIIFSDYSFIGYLGGFYGPSQGTGFDESFTTTIDFSVWEIDLSAPRGTSIATGDRTIPLVPTGMPIEATFNDTPGDYLASCMIHATPSSQGRPVYVVQFWRSVPERYNPNIDDKDYDQAASPMTGWAGEDTCAAAISTMGPDRIAALANEDIPTSDPPTRSQPIEPTEPLITGDWTSIETWEATGRDALTKSLADGSVITVGCTESLEIVIAISPGSAVLRINNVDVRRAEPDVSYILVAGDTPSEFVIEASGQANRVALASDLLLCEAS